LVDTRRILRGNLKGREHEACLRRWMCHLRLQRWVWLVWCMRKLGPLLSGVQAWGMGTWRLLQRELLVRRVVLRMCSGGAILRHAIAAKVVHWLRLIVRPW
jgi:hypothetical protein